MARYRPRTLVNKSFKQPRGGVVTQAYIDRLIAAGAGSGSLGSYIPWLKIGSFSPRSPSAWVPGVRVQRTHQTLSTGESNFLILMEFNERVLDIREQFPIVDYAATHAIAISKNIIPAYYLGTSVPYVFTADFMLTMDNGADGTCLEAYSIKSREELADLDEDKRARVIQKFEVEREYWRQQGISYQMVFSEDFPKNKIANLKLIRVYATLSSAVASEGNIKKIMQALQCMDLSLISRLPLEKIVREISRSVFIEYLSTKRIFFYLVWHHYIHIELDQYVLSMKTPVIFKSVAQTLASQTSRGVA